MNQCVISLTVDMSVSVTYQTLQPLSHNRSEASFAGQFRDQEDVLWCCDLVGAVSATW